jgi:hypothetical protein
MKKTKIIIIFCFALISTNLLSKNEIQSISINLCHSDDRNLLNHLNQIVNDLITKNIFSTNKVYIQNNYTELNNISINTRNFTFVSADKATIQNNKSNTIHFWRIDSNSTSAHYEFYLQLTPEKIIKYDYKFEFINNQWIIKQ